MPLLLLAETGTQCRKRLHKCRRSHPGSVPGQACGRVAGFPGREFRQHEGDDGQRGNGDGVDTDELNEELEDLNCVREDYSDGATGIGPEEIDLIIDLCNGKEIPTDKRLSLLRAIHHIKDTQIERSILESINGSDSRISKFLDEAEQMGGAAPDSD